MKRPLHLGDTTVLRLTGDDDALEYGGGVVFTNPDGAWWQFWSPPSGKSYTVYTAPIHSNVFSAARQVTTPAELEELTGTPISDLKRMSRSAMDKERASLVEIIKAEYGPSAVAPADPEVLTAHELIQRWGPAYGIEVESAPRVDDCDYLILESSAGHRCGTVGGVALGLFQDHKDALIAIARHRHKVGSRGHTFWEKGSELERVEFNARMWAYQYPSEDPPHPKKPLWLRLTRKYRIESKRSAKRHRNVAAARRKYASSARQRDRRDRMDRSQKGPAKSGR